VSQFLLLGALLGAMAAVDKLLGLEDERRLLGYKSGSLVGLAVSLCIGLIEVAGGVIAGRIAPRSALWSAPVLCVALAVASSTTFPFEVTPWPLFKSVLLSFIGACIGSRLASRRAERA